MTSPHPSRPSRQEGVIAACLIAAFVLIALCYSLAPVFEGQDEPEHYAYVRELALTGELPNRLDPNHWEYHQPPLYYALAVPLKWLLPDDDFEQVYEQRLMDAPAMLNQTTRGINFMAHGPREEFPYTGSQTALAVHILRLYSIALAVLTLITCRAIFQMLWPGSPAIRLAALGLMCFWPQFLCVSAWFNNDSLTNLIGALALLVTLRQTRDGISWRGAALTGAILGAGLLTKLTLVTLVVPIGLIFAVKGPKTWRYGLAVAGVAFAVAGWWFIRNGILYHDPFGTEAQYAALPMVRRNPLTMSPAENFAQAWAPISKVWISFGFYTTVNVPEIFQWFFVALLALGVIAAVKQVIRWRAAPPDANTRGQVIILGGFGAALAIAVCSFALVNSFGVQGRYLFPALAALAGLLAMGFGLWPERLRMPVVLSTLALAAAIALVACFGFYLPAYRPTPAPAKVAHSLGLQYGDALTLVGTDQAEITGKPGRITRLTLYWRARNTTEENIYIGLHTSGYTLFAVENVPANGLMLSRLWEAGQSWSETYQLMIDPDARPGTYHVYVQAFNAEKRTPLPVIGPDGKTLWLQMVADIIIR